MRKVITLHYTDKPTVYTSQRSNDPSSEWVVENFERLLKDGMIFPRKDKGHGGSQRLYGCLIIISSFYVTQACYNIKQTKHQDQTPLSIQRRSIMCQHYYIYGFNHMSTAACQYFLAIIKFRYPKSNIWTSVSGSPKQSVWMLQMR